MDFFRDCRIATQFCTLLTRPPWLDTVWQERITFPALAAQRQAARRREPTQKKSSIKKGVLRGETPKRCWKGGEVWRGTCNEVSSRKTRFRVDNFFNVKKVASPPISGVQGPSLESPPLDKDDGGRYIYRVFLKSIRRKQNEKVTRVRTCA